jgi:hypothetical protein
VAKHHVVLILAVILFGAACLSPALAFRVFTNTPVVYKLERMSGGAVLALGWFGVLRGQWAWSANPLAMLGWAFLLFGRRRIALATLAISVAVAFTTFAARRQQFPHDEGDVTHMTLDRPLIGFYLWVASLALMFIAIALWPMKKEITKPRAA